MKIKLFLFLCIASFGLSSQSFAGESKYKIDDDFIDMLFESSHDVTDEVLVDIMEFNGLDKSSLAGGDDTQLVSGIVALASWALGVGWFIPIHRLILGAGNATGKILLLYCITGWCSFGVLTAIDGILLLIDDTDKYVDSEKFLLFTED